MEGGHGNIILSGLFPLLCPLSQPLFHWRAHVHILFAKDVEKEAKRLCRPESPGLGGIFNEKYNYLSATLQFPKATIIYFVSQGKP